MKYSIYSDCAFCLVHIGFFRWVKINSDATLINVPILNLIVCESGLLLDSPIEALGKFGLLTAHTILIQK